MLLTDDFSSVLYFHNSDSDKKNHLIIYKGMATVTT